ncbi:RVP_2 domain-containing protein [Gossypium australe]|uniref:RVP_2 domain-containing protein n=1 Tax=Gossypium australe TaxID=47621 RepID=A0A5B6WJG0_9ROSI|nr:RVP_2 domain-containing protein [Gossypium australe]
MVVVVDREHRAEVRFKLRLDRQVWCIRRGTVRPEFDLILGVDWLVEHRVGLDYESKMVSFKVGDEEEAVMVGECRDYLSNTIFDLITEKSVRKVSDVYLAYMHDISVVSLAMERIHTVKDFPDVFPEELLRLPLDRKVEDNSDVHCCIPYSTKIVEGIKVATSGTSR